MLESSFGAIRDWLLDLGGTSTGLVQLSDELCLRLRREGLPIDRLNLGVFALHPEMAGYAVLWQSDTGATIEVPVRREDTLTPTYFDSPIHWLASEGGQLSFDLSREEERSRFPVLNEFAEAGHHWYRGYCLRYGEQGTAVLSLCSKSPEGFNPSQCRGIESLFPALRLVIHLVETRRLAETVLQTYLGRDTSKMVLSGRILRGQGESINAALWLCDLREFTAMTSAMGTEAVIETMNEYFDTMAEAVWAEGGEILKFMGDAMLVVFRIDEDASSANVVQRAIRAAVDAQDRLAVLSRQRELRGLSRLRTGIAVHLGEVVYGNIGASRRLDFTVMGPSVNLLSRIQGLTGEKEEPLLFSEVVSQYLKSEAEPIGTFTFKGIPDRSTLYRLKDPRGAEPT